MGLVRHTEHVPKIRVQAYRPSRNELHVNAKNRLPEVSPLLSDTKNRRPLTSKSYISRELSKSTWPDFEKLFEKHGGVQNGCWCMYYHRPNKVRTKMSPEKWATTNRRDKRTLVVKGRSHGILVYDGERAVGWCQFGERDELPRLDSGRSSQKLVTMDDGKKLWRITCFFVDKGYRMQGVAATALNAALDSIKKRGGGMVEAYPVTSTKRGSWSLWSGTPVLFEREKFKRVSRLGKGPAGTSHILMRRTIQRK